MLQGGRIIDWAPPLGEASRIGSTPLSSVIAVTAPDAFPAVETIITASPFWRSARVARGTRLSIC